MRNGLSNFSQAVAVHTDSLTLKATDISLPGGSIAGAKAR